MALDAPRLDAHMTATCHLCLQGVQGRQQAAHDYRGADDTEDLLGSYDLDAADEDAQPGAKRCRRVSGGLDAWHCEPQHQQQRRDILQPESPKMTGAAVFQWRQSPGGTAAAAAQTWAPSSGLAGRQEVTPVQGHVVGSWQQVMLQQQDSEQQAGVMFGPSSDDQHAAGLPLMAGSMIERLTPMFQGGQWEVQHASATFTSSL